MHFHPNRQPIYRANKAIYDEPGEFSSHSFLRQKPEPEKVISKSLSSEAANINQTAIHMIRRPFTQLILIALLRRNSCGIRGIQHESINTPRAA